MFYLCSRYSSVNSGHVPAPETRVVYQMFASDKQRQGLTALLTLRQCSDQLEADESRLVCVTMEHVVSFVLPVDTFIGAVFVVTQTDV